MGDGLIQDLLEPLLASIRRGAIQNSLIIIIIKRHGPAPEVSIGVSAWTALSSDGPLSDIFCFN